MIPQGLANKPLGLIEGIGEYGLWLKRAVGWFLLLGIFFSTEPWPAAMFISPLIKK